MRLERCEGNINKDKNISEMVQPLWKNFYIIKKSMVLSSPAVFNMGTSSGGLCIIT